MRTAPTSRAGVGLPLVVVTLMVLATIICSMVFFSGSQTKQLQHQLARAKARQLALAGLQVAADRLRNGRWYAADDKLYGFINSRDEPALGLTGGEFTVLCEDSVNGVEPTLANVPHVDVYARGESGGESYAAYGRFIMAPAPLLVWPSTNGQRYERSGQLVETPYTVKRLVRVTELPDPQLFEIEAIAVRRKILQRFDLLSREFRENYALVRWDARPGTVAETTASDAEARAFLAQFVDARPVAFPTNLFVHDRLFDMVLEGTEPGARAGAGRVRTIELGLQQPPADPADVHFIQDACRVTGVQVAHPEAGRRERFPPQYALRDLHQFTRAEFNAGSYQPDLTIDPDAQVKYRVNFSGGGMTESEYQTLHTTGYDDSRDVRHGGSGLWYTISSVEGPNWLSRPYWTSDPGSSAGGSPGDAAVYRLDDVANFFVKYCEPGPSQPTGSFIRSRWFIDHGQPVPTPPPGPGDPDATPTPRPTPPPPPPGYYEGGW